VICRQRTISLDVIDRVLAAGSQGRKSATKQSGEREPKIRLRDTGNVPDGTLAQKTARAGLAGRRPEVCPVISPGSGRTSVYLGGLDPGAIISRVTYKVERTAVVTLTAPRQTSMSSKLDDLLSGRKTSYWANRGIVTLNIMLLLPQLSSYATGYDGSMMNGLQSVLDLMTTTSSLMSE
jgi:hypothetical protein